MKKLVIYGAGDIGRLAKYYFDTDSDFEPCAFIVDAEYKKADEFCQLPVVVPEEAFKTFPQSRYLAFIAMSYTRMNSVRKEKYLLMKQKGYKCASYISSRCSFLTQHPPGENCFILEDNTVQPYVKLGSNITLWSGNHIGHDSSIADHCFLASHIVVSGNCHIGESCFIGVNATLRNGLKIASHSLIGAGAVIMEDTVEEGVYLAERAKRIPKCSSEINL
jgi:sugar O-acyltransferase (sialic acid O-acetyltransferase NeuD family)